jgi:hypothetical protein
MPFATLTSATLARRTVLTGAMLFAAGAAVRAADTAANGNAPSVKLAEDAAIWGIPLVRTGRYLALTKARGLALNRFYLNQALATPDTKLAGPNVDTIYGFAWLDLSHGPVVVDVPDGGDRYYSVQFIDAYETILGYAGNSATSKGPGSYVVSGPGWRGKLLQGAKRIASPTSLVLALTRTLVKSPADLPAAQALQARLSIAPLAHYPAGKQPAVVEQEALNVFPTLKIAGDGAAFFSELDALVQRFPPTGQEADAFRRLAPLYLGHGFAQHNTLQPAALQHALDGALARVHAANVADTNDGWRVNYHIRAFNADPVTRAALNSVGPGANIAEEALYFTATTDSAGAKLDGANSYSLTFPKGGLPPAKSFWSLILYDGGNFFLVDNPIHRYTINDRSTDLVHAGDGSLPIVISHAKPAGTVNWLPAPAGPFLLVLRTYEPDSALLTGAWKVPPVVRTAK